MIIGTKIQNYGDSLYVVFRVLVGLLFMQHGLQKIFGMFGGIGGGGSVELMSLMGLAGMIELLGGLGIATGFFARLWTLLAGGQMLMAYGMKHMSGSLIPMVNGGELALLYFAVFLVVLKRGAGKLSLERTLLKKETF